jgi:hypothetical protein
MELFQWSRFIPNIYTAFELLQKENHKHIQKTIFLMTDDKLVLNDALNSQFKDHISYINETIPEKPPHEMGGNKAAYTRNFFISFLNLELCLRCDAFVGQRASNFARLIDELRMTRVSKYEYPFIEVGEYTFGW